MPLTAVALRKGVASDDSARINAITSVSPW
jgi:hypothetical protein